jgi:hypothetical protein
LTVSVICFSKAGTKKIESRNGTGGGDGSGIKTGTGSRVCGVEVKNSLLKRSL